MFNLWLAILIILAGSAAGYFKSNLADLPFILSTLDNNTQIMHHDANPAFDKKVPVDPTKESAERSSVPDPVSVTFLPPPQEVVCFALDVCPPADPSIPKPIKIPPGHDPFCHIQTFPPQPCPDVPKDDGFEPPDQDRPISTPPDTPAWCDPRGASFPERFPCLIPIPTPPPTPPAPCDWPGRPHPTQPDTCLL